MEDSKLRNAIEAFYLRYGFSTRCLHAGEKIGQPKLNSHTNAIFASSTFTFENAEEGADLFARRKSGYIYSRMGNPTVVVAEAKLNSLEGRDLKLREPDRCISSLLYSSGMGAIASLAFGLLRPGDTLLRGETLYGSTDDFFQTMLPKFGVKSVVVNTEKPTEMRHVMAANPQARMLFFETPTNPLLGLTDISETVKIVREVNADTIIAVDNTFCTPYLQQPLSLGADVVMHSTTKYLSGHGALIGGSLTTSQDAIKEELFHTMKDTGACPSPFDTWLLNMGMKTLPLRMERHCSNAQIIAEWLEKHPRVSRVFFPGLKSFPQYELAKRQMRLPGGMISFEIDGDYTAATRVLNNVHLCTLAVSLGCVDSLIQHPASMTHAMVPPEARAHAGITDNLIRLSVGIEEVEDLIADLDQALNKI